MCSIFLLFYSDTLRGRWRKPSIGASDVSTTAPSTPRAMALFLGICFILYFNILDYIVARSSASNFETTSHTDANLSMGFQMCL